MTIPFRHFPYLVQQLVMDHMDLIDLFRLHYISEKSKTLAKSYFNRLECVLEYNLTSGTHHWPRFSIKRKKSSDNYCWDRDSVSFEPKLHVWKHMYHFLSWKDTEEDLVEVFQITVESCDDMYKGVMKFAKDLFPKIHFSFDFGRSNLEVIRRTMRTPKTLKVPVEQVKVDCSRKSLRVKGVLKACSDVKTLKICNFPREFQYDFQTNPPFKFDFFESDYAEWVTKDHLINLLMGCKKVCLSAWRLSYTDQELVEICEKWLEAPRTQYLQIHKIETSFEGIGKLPGAVPLREAKVDYPRFDRRLKLDPGKGYMMKKADGTPAIVYHYGSCIVFTTEFKNAVVG